MVDKAIVKEIVFSGIDEINEELEVDERAKKSLDTILFGESAELDSMMFVNLIVIIEEGISERFDIEITLDFQNEMFTEEPLITLEMFANNIASQLEGYMDE